jgi:hypothetical protein
MVMSSDETPREEPKFEAAAPSIIPAAGEAKAGTRAAAEPATAGAARSESSEKPPETPRPSAERGGPAAESQSPFERKGETTVTRLPALRTASEDQKAGPEIAKPRGNSRFALLAACVAIAASFGAVAGSLGVARLGPMFASAPPPAPVTKDSVAEEVKALKDTVAQLRGTTKALSDNLAALRTSVGSSNAAQNTQIGRIAETLDRVEKAQTEHRKAASETTGSIAQKQAVPMVLGDPPTTLKPPVVQGWVLRRVYDGAALIEGRDGIVEVEPGVIAPGIGRIESIKRQDGRWVVVTSRGLIVGR